MWHIFWSESLIFDLIYWGMDKNPEEQERIFFQISGWIYLDGPYLLKAQPLKKKKKTTLSFSLQSYQTSGNKTVNI